jgi:hypothetical protein
MSLELGLHALVAADASVAALVSTRIFPVVVPNGTEYPAMSYMSVSADPTEFALDNTATYTKRIQFDLSARDYPTVKQLETALTALLDGYSGTLSNNVRVINSEAGFVVDDYTPDAFDFRTIVEFSITYTF